MPAAPAGRLMARRRPATARIVRPDFPARVLLASLATVLLHGGVPNLLLRADYPAGPLLAWLVPSPSATRLVEWLCFVVVPLAGPGLAGPFLFGSRRPRITTAPLAAERELLASGWIGLLAAQCLSTPVGIAFYRVVGLPLPGAEVALAAFFGWLAGCFGLCLVRAAVLGLGGRRYLGALAALPLLAALWLPAVLRPAWPAIRPWAVWTPGYHATVLLQVGLAAAPWRLVYSAAILAAYIALGWSLVLGLAESRR